MDERHKGVKNLFEAASLPELEEKVADYWEKEGTFKKSLDKSRKGKPFTFYDGPPFATGLPHYGHILASTIKDVVPRYQTMNGRYVRRRWGWDCHGLPIEEIVERELGISGKKQIEEIGIKKFNEICRSTVLKYVDEWRKMVRRMGRWVDFDNSYKTMDRDYMESVWWGFKKIYDKGHVYEGRKVLLYCPRCETPLSNFEVAMDQSYKDVTEESVYVKFKVKGRDEYFLAWTTTPWTLPGNVALAVGEDIDYLKAKTSGGDILILAKALAEKILGKTYEIVGEMKGKALVGTSYEPLFDVSAVQSDRTFKVYAADFVTTEEGTGIVHTAVVYGEDDYQLGLREGLPVVPLLDEKGHFNDKAPEIIRGQYFKKAEKVIKEDLEKRGFILRREEHTHSYPHCWRCGTMLFYNAIPAWFINIQKIKGELLESNEKEVSWFPEHLKNGRYAKSIEAAPDWNISRNRYWGNPIPVWKCEKCEAVKVAGSVRDLGLPETTFYFIRHGEGEQNVAGIASSYPEVKEYHLTDNGREQVQALAEKLKDLGIDAIYSSDILRAKETAQIIGESLGKEVNLDERLREIGVGIYNGKPVKEILDLKPDNDWWHFAPEGGENWTTVQNRMTAFMSEIASRNRGKKIAVVSHGDPIWTVMQKFAVEGYPKFAQINEVKTDILDLHRPYIDEVVLKCDKCGGDSRRITEIFDSWVEAGSMPFAEYHYPFENKDFPNKNYPADFVAEYISQTRAWFYVMHVIGLELFDHAPFKNVVTTGVILAEDGSKMSKSKKNYPDPWEVINKYGVDSLRFYLMNSGVMHADNLNFSMKDLEGAHRKVTMLLWNVYQYFMTYAAEAGWEAGGFKLFQSESKNVLDRWIKARTKELVRGVTDGLDGYDTVKATRAIEGFIDDLSTWYLRRSRGRTDSGFYGAFYETLITALKVIAPFMPHLTEAMYLSLTANFGGGSESVHLSEWPEKKNLTTEEQKLLKDMVMIRRAAGMGLAARKNANKPVRIPLSRIGIVTKIQTSIDLLNVLKDELNVKEIILGNIPRERGKTDILLMSGEGDLEMQLDFYSPPELELEGLTRALERFVQEMRKTAGMKVGERAVLIYGTSNVDIEKALEAFNKEKTYIAAIEKGSPESADLPRADSAKWETFEADGKQAKFSIRRA